MKSVLLSLLTGSGLGKFIHRFYMEQWFNDSCTTSSGCSYQWLHGKVSSCHYMFLTIQLVWFKGQFSSAATYIFCTLHVKLSKGSLTVQLTLAWCTCCWQFCPMQHVEIPSHVCTHSYVHVASNFDTHNSKYPTYISYNISLHDMYRLNYVFLHVDSTWLPLPEYATDIQLLLSLKAALVAAGTSLDRRCL